MKISNKTGMHFTHTGRIQTKTKDIPYHVTATETFFIGDDGQEDASLFSFTYRNTAIPKSSLRPVVFAFNGGPGSSSIWMHLGLFGPRRVQGIDSVYPPQQPPFGLEDNSLSLLDICDIVIIDPVNTGYARLYNLAKAEEYYGVKQDTCAVALFIEYWLNRYARNGSPVYLCAESYGTIRACFLLRELAGGPFSELRRLIAIPVSGVMMIGTHIAASMFGNAPTVWSSAYKLPSWAAVRAYHENVHDPMAIYQETIDFVRQEYLGWLFDGNGAKDPSIPEKLSNMTGLAAERFVPGGPEVTEAEVFPALAGSRLDVGAYDGRYTMKRCEVKSPDPAGDDPAMGKYTIAFCSAMNGLYKGELGLETDREYRAIDFAVNGLWDFTSSVSPTEALVAAMRRNEGLRIFFGSGIYDLVTYAGLVRYLVSHLDLPQDRVTMREYMSGHMPYLGQQSRAVLTGDLRAFILNEKCVYEE